MGKEDGSIFGLMPARPRGRDGILERPSCKYPASTVNINGLVQFTDKYSANDL